jgi:phosphatidylglycerophosphatase A
MSSIKESSDELNPAVPVASKEVPARPRSSAVDYIALAIATCGVGYFPIAPGTVGSMVGVLIFLGLWSSFHSWSGLAVATPRLVALRLVSTLVATIFVTVAGIWAATRTERRLQKKDPSIVVIDEVAGQMVALLPLMVWLPAWWRVLAAFILFRAFDIWKPYPVRRLEGMKGGTGIMADDLGAGIYAALILLVLCALGF